MGSTTEIRQRAATDAKRILDRLQIGSALPVDPVAIARALDLEVLDVEMPREGLSGAIEKRSEDEQPVIYLSSSDPPSRRRFTCAHEIGHYIDNTDQKKFSYVDFRGAEQTVAEQYANEFAAHLLMPADEMRSVRKRLGEKPALVDIAVEAHRFGVSTIALQVHLRKF